MRGLFLIAALFLAACRGEPVPPDYQNVPTSTHSADTPEQAPAPESSTATPEPGSSAEGTSAPYEPAQPPPTP